MARGAIGGGLADGIIALLDLPAWMRSQTRTQRLIAAIENIAEGPAAARDERPLLSWWRAGGPHSLGRVCDLQETSNTSVSAQYLRRGEMLALAPYLALG